MEDLFEQISWYGMEPRYHRLKFVPDTQTLPESETLEVSSLDDEEDSDEVTQKVETPLFWKKFFQETLRGSDGGEEEQLPSEDTQKAITPKALRAYTLERGTLKMPEPQSDRTKDRGGERPLSRLPTASLPPSNPIKEQTEKPIALQATVKMPTPNSVKDDGRISKSQQSTVKMASPSILKDSRGGSIAQQATVKVPTPNGLKPQRTQKAGQHSTFSFDDDPDFEKLSTIPVMVLKDISKRQDAPQPAMKAEITEAAGSAAYVSIGNIGGSFLKYGSNIVISRGLGAAGFGLYTLGMSVVGLITAIFNLGLDDAMVRYISIYRAKRKIGSLRALSIFCTAVAGVSGILGALFMVVFAPYLAAVKHSPELISILIIMSPMVPLACMQTVWTSGLQGFKEFKGRVLLQRILMPLVLIILLLASLIFFRNLIAIVIASMISTLIGAVLSLFFFFRKAAEILRPDPEAYELRDWLGFAAPNFLTSIIDTVLESIDTLLLAFFAVSNVALGQYAAAIKISTFIIMPQASFNAMFAPTIAELHSQGEYQKLAAMFKVVTKWAITFSLPIFGIATLFSASLLSISGNEFVSAWPLVIAFALGAMINVSTGSVGYILLMTGHTRISFINSLTAVIVNVVVGVILAPRYGAMGVAIATGLAVGVVNVMKLLQVYILVKMQPYRWDVLKPIAAWLISSALTGALIYLFSRGHLFIQIGKFHLSLELSLVPVFLVSYIGLLKLFKISPEDQIVLNMLRKKLKRRKKNKKG